MEQWKLRISSDRADTLAYLFFLLRENSDEFLNREFIEPATRLEILNLMEWYEKGYQFRKAREHVEQTFRGFTERT